MAIVKKTITSVSKDVVELELSYIADEIVWKTIWQYFKKLHIELL